MFCYGHPEGAKEGSGWVIPKPDEFLTPIGLSITTPIIIIFIFIL